MPQRSGVWVPRKGKTGKKGKTGGGKEHDDDAVGETKTKKNRKNRKNKQNCGNVQCKQHNANSRSRLTFLFPVMRAA